jgi:hypothetical protein
VDQVLVEHQGQVAFAEDQDPVQQFTADSSDHALARWRSSSVSSAERQGDRRLRRSGDPGKRTLRGVEPQPVAGRYAAVPRVA